MNIKITPRFVIGVAVGLAIAGFFVAKVKLTTEMAVVSSISVIAFALPSYLAIMRTNSEHRGLAILAALGIYGIAVESLALITGYPYGSFTYSGLLASKVFGLAPWTVAFAYPPIILFAYALARRLNKSRTDIMEIAALTAFFATACDVVLDPAAVRLGFWYWDDPGFFYSVPLVNFAGWLLTSYIAGVLLHLLWGTKQVPLAVTYSGLAILWFWTAVNAWFGHLLPVLAGLLLLALYYRLFVRQPQISRR